MNEINHIKRYKKTYKNASLFVHREKIIKLISIGIQLTFNENEDELVWLCKWSHLEFFLGHFLHREAFPVGYSHPFFQKRFELPIF